MLRLTTLAALAALAASAMLPASAQAKSPPSCSAICAGKADRAQCFASCRENTRQKRVIDAVRVQPFNIQQLDRESGGGGGGRGGRN